MSKEDLENTQAPEGIDSILFDETAIENRVRDLAKSISEDWGSEDLAIVCVLTGSLVFTADLARKLPLQVEIDCLRMESYGNQSIAISAPRFSAPLKNNIEGKRGLLVDDILDTGRTLSSLISYLNRQNPSSIRTCVLLDKPARREVDIEADFVGFTIPDEFVVGYGLDYAERFRALPYIATVNLSKIQ